MWSRGRTLAGRRLDDRIMGSQGGLIHIVQGKTKTSPSCVARQGKVEFSLNGLMNK